MLAGPFLFLYNSLMKNLKNKVFLLFLLSVGLTAHATPVRDVVLTTTDKTCSIHYLTHNNTTGWFLTDISGSCASGTLSGEGSVIVRNAFGKAEERLIGYFNQGYWTGAEPTNLPLKTLLLNHDSEEQFLTYDLGKEERLDVHYLGKMTATRRSDNTYGPFLSCDPVRILAITSDSELFSDESVQQGLISSAVQRARNVCPQTMQIQFYGSDRDNPQNEDIFFFADIDLETKHIKVRRTPSSLNTQRMIQVKNNLTEKTVLPKESIQPNVLVSSEKNEDLNRHDSSSLLPQEERNKTTLPILDVDTEIRLDKIPHLLTASRLLKQAVDGKALVHIDSFNEMGEAVADKPVHLKIKGNGLSLGWGVLEGNFTYIYPRGKLDEPRGTAEAISFTPYEVQE